MAGSEPENTTDRGRLSWLIPELVKVLPQLLWVGLAASALMIAVGPGLRLIERDKVSRISIAGIQVDFAREQLALVEGRNAARLVTPDVFAAFRARIEREAEFIQGARVLWVDGEHPLNNVYERRALAALGVSIDTVSSSEEALDLLRRDGKPYYHLVISDLGRQGQDNPPGPCYSGVVQGPANAGCGLLAEIRALPQETAPPVIFYAATGNADGIPGSAFGLTNRVDELLQLVLDALQRRQDVAAPGSTVPEA